jgi:biotin carboxyl carrier protein
MERSYRDATAGSVASSSAVPGNAAPGHASPNHAAAKSATELLKVSAKRQGRTIVLETAEGPRTFAWQNLSPGEYLLRIDGHQKRCVVAQDGEDRWVWVDGHVHHLVHETGSHHGEHHPSSNSLVSPMPGLVLKVFVAAGDVVTRNQVLAVLEAMKMQYEIAAPRDGTIAAVAVSEGQQVKGDVTLVTLQEEAE